MNDVWNAKINLYPHFAPLLQSRDLILELQQTVYIDVCDLIAECQSWYEDVKMEAMPHVIQILQAYKFAQCLHNDLQKNNGAFYSSLDILHSKLSLHFNFYSK